jgi:hypothetical protein
MNTKVLPPLRAAIFAGACAMPLGCGTAPPASAPSDLALTFRTSERAPGSYDVFATLVQTGSASKDCTVGVGLYGWCDPPEHDVHATALSSGCDADACTVTTLPSGAGEMHFLVGASAPNVTFRLRAQSDDGRAVDGAQSLPH